MCVFAGQFNGVCPSFWACVVDTHVDVVDISARGFLPLGQSLDQGFGGRSVEAVGAVDDDVVLGGCVPKEVDVIQVFE